MRDFERLIFSVESGTDGLTQKLLNQVSSEVDGRLNLKIIEATIASRSDVSRSNNSQRNGSHSVSAGGHKPFSPNSGADGNVRPDSWLLISMTSRIDLEAWSGN
jgi:hypothetical protein